LRSDLQVRLIDATRKKVNFQKHIIRTLGLKNIEARHVRAEELKKKFRPDSTPYNIIISKAVSRLDIFLDQAMPLLGRPGIMIAMKGESVEAELEDVSSRIEAEDLSLIVKRYRLPQLDIERSLIILSNSS
jgi:16S rRNA (guanine527-N7)-methyltransferase